MRNNTQSNLNNNFLYHLSALDLSTNIKLNINTFISINIGK